MWRTFCWSRPCPQNRSEPQLAYQQVNTPQNRSEPQFANQQVNTRQTRFERQLANQQVNTPQNRSEHQLANQKVNSPRLSAQEHKEWPIFVSKNGRSRTQRMANIYVKKMVGLT